MELLVTYDVATETKAGKRRLQRVSKRCQAYGQRVQKSVFECTLGDADVEQLLHDLKKEIKESEDSLRIYRLMEPRERHLLVIGKDIAHDMHDPLVL